MRRGRREGKGNRRFLVDRLACEAGVYYTGEVEDGGPFAVAVGLPDDFAVEECGGFGGGEVVVEVEVFCVGGFVLFAEVEAGVGGFPLGGEDEGGVEVAGFGGGLLHLVEGEVLDGEDFDGVAGVADLGAGELGGGGPCGEDGGLREALVRMRTACWWRTIMSR